MSKRGHKAELKELLAALKELNLPQVEMDSRVHSFIERAGGLDKFMPLDEAIDALDTLCGKDPPSNKTSRDSFVRAQAIKAHFKGKLAMKEVGGILGVEVGSFLRWAQFGFQKLINSNFLFEEGTSPSDPHVLTDLQMRIVEELSREAQELPDLLDTLERIGVDKSESTVRRALNDLKRLGIVGNRRACGYYLVERPPKPSIQE